MREAVIYFLSNMIAFASAVWLCLIIVRSKVKRPFWEAMTVAMMSTAVYCAICAPLEPFWSDVLMPVYLVIAFLYYNYVTDLPTTKLLFIMMLVYSIMCFVVGLNIALKFDRYDADLLYFNLITVLVLMPPMYLLLNKTLWPVVQTLGGDEWRLLWIIPLVFSVLEVIIAYALTGMPLWLHVGVLALSVALAFITYYLMFMMLKKTEERITATERSRAAESYLHLQGEQYEVLTKRIAETRAARHDLHHQMVVMKGYLNEGKLEAAKQFCDELGANIPHMDEVYFCGNFAVNAVAAYFYNLARQEGFQIELKLGIPQKLASIDDRDLCVIVGNLLENAIEACRRMEGEGKRYIRMETKMQQHNLFITMVNSFEGRVRRRAGAFLSSKRSGEGIGLSSVRAVAQKYKGDVLYEFMNNTFTSVVYVYAPPGE